jgi:hypothetical protein
LFLEEQGKRTRALNIRYFFLTDQVEKGNLTIEYCPTDEMVGDFHTKPLQGEKFRKFQDAILGCALFNTINAQLRKNLPGKSTGMYTGTRKESIKNQNTPKLRTHAYKR